MYLFFFKHFITDILVGVGVVLHGWEAVPPDGGEARDERDSRQRRQLGQRFSGTPLEDR